MYTHTHNTYTAWHPMLRPVARLLIATLLCNTLAPLSALAQTNSAQPAINPIANAQLQRLAQWQQNIQQSQAAQAQLKASASERTAHKLRQSHELVRAIGKPGTAPNTSQRSSQTQQLQQLLGDIDDDTDAALEEFHSSRGDLLKQQASPDMLARHDQIEAELRQRAQSLRQSLRAWRVNPSDANLAALKQFFEQYPAARTPAPPPAGKLPWSTPKPNTRAPATSKADWSLNLYTQQPIRSTLASFAPAGMSAANAPTATTAAASTNTRTTLGPLQFNIAPEPTQAPTLADLAATPEVTLSPAIQAKAVELGNNPVTIHNWVRNTIEYVPTWGAIQSADGTLQSLRGNAFDTASLEIALLRAAHIPARYQFGTVDIAADKVQNWVGGTANPQAALQLLNQGGIAASGISSGGRITTIRLEHVWVNAYVNWTPSRGNKQGGGAANPKISTPNGILQHVNPNGPLNAWVPLDASFKQYSYTQGMDLKTQVPLDAQALLNAASQGATVNANYAQNLNQANLQTQLAS